MSRSAWRFPPEWLVFSVIVVDLIGFGILIPILPFMSPALGGDEMDVALVIAIYSLCAGIAGPFWGSLSDRIGRKQVLMVCLFGGALSYGMIGVASELWMLYAARAVGGVLAGPEGAFLWPGLFAAVMSLVSVGLAGWLLPADRPSVENTKKAQKASGSENMLAFIRRRHALLLTLQYTLHTGAVSAAIYLSPLWLAAYLGWGPREVGILFGLVGVAMIVVQGAMIDWMTRTFGLINVLTGGAAIFAASLVAAISVETEFARGFVIFTAFAGATCCLPVLNTVASSIVGAQERGRMMGVTALAASIGRVIGPLATGLVLAVSDYPVSWFVIALPVCLVLLWSRTGAARYARSGGLQPLDS